MKCQSARDCIVLLNYGELPDELAGRDGDLRIVDESGEDYLFSADRFEELRND